MPEATVLYTVTAMVVTGLVLWVGVVLRSAKEPWARPAPNTIDLEPLPAAAGDAPLLATDASVAPSSEAAPPETAPPATSPPASPIDADETARATPVALSEGRLKALEAEAAAEQAEQAAKKS